MEGRLPDAISQNPKQRGAMTTLYSDSPCQVIIWARKAKAVYVPLLGTGGASVKANKADFIALMLEFKNPLEKEYAYNVEERVLYV